MIQIIFDQTVLGLIWLGSVLGMSYEEVNVLIYFAFIPIAWSFMIGVIYHIKPWIMQIVFASIGAAIYLIGIDRIFNAGVEVENWLSIFGWDYYEASVYTCVIFPILTTFGLIRLMIKKSR